MKICTKCGKTKAETEFNWKKKGVRRNSKCKDCHKAYRDQHYRDNKQKRIAQARRRNDRIRVENRIKMLQYLDGKECEDCGETDPVVLEFDHKDANKKTASVSRLVDQNCWETVLKETRKCVVRCANCHRRKTAKERGWYRYK